MSKSILFISTLVLSFQASAKIKVIYGEDNRKDVYESTNPMFINLSKSTAAMIPNRKLLEFNAEQVSVRGETLEEFGVCSHERFSAQLTAANCSGFLVSKNKLVTAGHCVQRDFDCETNSWVFDYKVGFETQGEVIVDKSSVYKCKKIISQELNSSTKSDYAVIELEREVLDRPTLSYRTGGKAKKGDELVVIGHPSGLPTKIADGAIIRDINDIYLTANLDTYGGNSGSAVFNATTGIVEGILVRGETDYIFNSELGCRESNVLANDAGDGEEVTLITIVKGLDPIKPPKPEPEVVPEVEAPTPKPPKPERRLSWIQRLLRAIFG